MKRVLLVTLVAVGFIPLLCIAEDGSVSGEKKYSSSETGDGSTAGERKSLTLNASERRQKIHVNHRYRTAMSHRERAGFCRDRYCSHASGSPWWPGAPGD
ncbi:MAG: hypothetical protein DME82_13770 [Verrucomicrobia bacterium]|nr:MAG: hypothetical protein DME82_13770 [Verrucomicrobiota bacterium]